MKSLEAVTQALDYIEERLADPLDVDSVAAAAGLSPAYFQRLFRATVGMPVLAYVRRRRLSRSVGELLETDRRILEIAIEAGFDSQEAYTRAFKARFGLPPGRFRERGKRMPSDHYPAMTRSRIERRQGAGLRPARIIDRPDTRFVGIAGTFTSALSDEANEAEVLPALWLEFLERQSRIVGRRNPDAFGLCWPEPATCGLRSDELRYLAGVEADAATEIPTGMQSVVAPAMRYAVFEHSGSVLELPATIVHALVEWLPSSEFEYVTGVEIDFHAADGLLEYWLPVREGERR